jgi:hypothetical protein
VSDESSRRLQYRKFNAAYIGPYEITKIERPDLVFIPKFEVGSKVLVRDKCSRRRRSRKLDAAY